MADNLSVRVIGLEAIRQKLSGQDLYAFPVRVAMQDAGDAVVKRARENAPEDRGELKASIKATLDARPLPRFVAVGSDKLYARVVEEGRRPGAKMPPPEALAGWAERHGIDRRFLFVLARAIGRRGIPGTHFLERAIEESRFDTEASLLKAAKNIEAIWRRRGR